MPNPGRKTYTLRNSEGKTLQIDNKEFDDNLDAYIRDNEGVEIRMRGEDGDFFVPISDYNDAFIDGYRPFTTGYYDEHHVVKTPDGKLHGGKAMATEQTASAPKAAAPKTEQPADTAKVEQPEQLKQPQPQQGVGGMSDAERAQFMANTFGMSFGALQKNNAVQANIGRMQRANTVQGRQQQRANEAAVRTMGGRTRTNDIAATSPQLQLQGGGNVEAAESQAKDTRGPVAVGVVYDENDNPVTQWQMPDGSITTDQNMADMAGIKARGARLAQAFNDRMRENGLDKNKPEDVEQQRYNDAKDAVERSSAAQEMMERVLGGKADEAMRFAQKRFDDKFAEIGKAQAGNAPYNDKLDRFAQGAVQTKEANRAYTDAFRDYANALVSNLENKLGSTRFVDKLTEEAKAAGIEPTLYIRAFGEQAVNALQDQMQRKQVEKYMPKSDAEYIMSGLQNSIMGMVQRAVYETGEQAAYRDQATAEYGEQAGTGARLANMGVGFVADAPFFGLSGKLSGEAIKTVAEREISNMMAKGMTREMAQQAVASAMRNSFGRRVGEKVFQGVLGGAVNLGTFNAMSETARQMAYEEANPLGVLKETGRGVLTGSALGVAGGLVGGATADLTGAKKFGGKVLGFGTEAGVFAAADRLLGEDSGRTWAEDYMHSVMNLAVMKATSPGTWAKGAARGLGFVKAATHGDGMKYVRETARDAARSENEKSGGFKFSDQQIAELKQSRGAHNLLDALTGMESAGHQERTIRKERNGEQIITDAEGKEVVVEYSEAMQKAQAAYEEVLNDPEVTFDTKQALARYMGDETERVAPNAMSYDTDESDGKFTVTTRDAKGYAIKRETYDDEQQFEERLAGLQQEITENNERARTNEAILNTVITELVNDGVANEAELTEYLKNRTTGNEERDAQLGALVTDKFAQLHNRGEYAAEQNRKAYEAGRDAYARADAQLKLESQQPQQPTVDENGQPVPPSSDGGAGVQQGNSVLDGMVERAKAAREEVLDTWGDEGEEMLSYLDDDPTRALLSASRLGGAYADIALEYVNAISAVNGYRDAATDGVTAKREAVTEGVRKRVNQDESERLGHDVSQTATLRETIKDEQGNDVKDEMGNALHKQSYVVSGTIKRNADGVIIKEESDKAILTYNPEADKYEFVDIGEIEGLGDYVDAQQEMDEALAGVDAEAEALTAGLLLLDETPERPQGEKEPATEHTANEPLQEGEYVLTTADGQQVHATVKPDKFGGYEVTSDVPLKAGQIEGYFAPEEIEAFNPIPAPGDKKADVRQGTDIVADTAEPQTITDTSAEPTHTSQIIDIKPFLIQQYHEKIPLDENGELMFAAPGVDADTVEPQTKADRTAPRDPRNPRDPTRELSALDRIPVDEHGEPMFGAPDVDTDTAYDGLLQYMEDEGVAQEYANSMVAQARQAVKAAQSTKVDFNGSASAFKEGARKKAEAVAAAQEQLERWQQIAGTPQRRAEQAAQAEQQRLAAERIQREEEEKAAHEQREAERLAAEAESRRKAEELNGVRDWTEEAPGVSRERGWRRVNGERVDRQEPVQATNGKEVEIRFSKNDIAHGHAALMEADDLQPSHVNGQKNPRTFLNDAQPKDRTDTATRVSEHDVMSNFRPQDITGGSNAYFGSPSVNERGEGIQGNNRMNLLKVMYDKYPEVAAKYKQYLVDHAAELGVDAEEVKRMAKPVHTYMLDVNDDEAVRLGAMTSTDIETGGRESIKPEHTLQKMGNAVVSYANILLASTDENESLSEILNRNGRKAILWLNQNGYINDTQAQSATDRNGYLTAKAKDELKDILFHNVFKDGAVGIKDAYEALPVKAQRAILATSTRDMGNAEGNKLTPVVQQAILAYNELKGNPAFASAGSIAAASTAAKDWATQYAIDDATNDSTLPSEKYSEEALQLAAMFRGMPQSVMQDVFNNIYDSMQGKSSSLFDLAEEKKPMGVGEAVRTALGSNYKPIKPNISHEQDRSGNVGFSAQDGQRGSGGVPGVHRGTEPVAAAAQPANDTAGADAVAGGEPGRVASGTAGAGAVAGGEPGRAASGTAGAQPGVGGLPAQAANGTAGAQPGVGGEPGRVANDIDIYAVGQDSHSAVVVQGDRYKMQTLRGMQTKKGTLRKDITKKYPGLKLFSVFNADNGELVGFAKSARDAYNLAINHDIENFDVMYSDWTRKIFDYGAYNLFDGKSDFNELRDENGVLRESIQQSVADKIQKLQDNVDGVERDSSTQPASQPIGKSSTPEEKQAQRDVVNTQPTEGQKAAGNYPEGSTRSGKEADGKPAAGSQPGKAEDKMQFNGEVTEAEFNDAIDTLRDLLGADDDDVDGLMFRDPGELTKAEKVKLKMAGLTVAQAIVENGAVSIEDFTKQMLKVTRTNKIRPWVKSFYEAMRMEPGYEDVAFTPHEDVVKFDVANYGKPTVDAMATAATVVAEQKADEASKAADADMPVADNTPKEPIAESAKYSITPMQYTTKSKKVLDVWNVKPAEKMDTDAFRMATARAKEIDKGWYDRKSGGFLMRTEEGAKQLAKEFFGTSDDVKSAEQEQNATNVESSAEDKAWEKHFEAERDKNTADLVNSLNAILSDMFVSKDHIKILNNPTKPKGSRRGYVIRSQALKKRMEVDDVLKHDVEMLLDIYSEKLNEVFNKYESQSEAHNNTSLMSEPGTSRDEQDVRAAVGKTSSAEEIQAERDKAKDEPKEYTGTVILKDGRRAVIIAAMHSGEQVGPNGQFTKPELDKYVGAVGRESIDIKPEDIDEELTERFRAESTLPLEERTVRFENGRVVKQEATEAKSDTPKLDAFIEQLDEGELMPMTPKAAVNLLQMMNKSKRSVVGLTFINNAATKTVVTSAASRDASARVKYFREYADGHVESGAQDFAMLLRQMTDEHADFTKRGFDLPEALKGNKDIYRTDNPDIFKPVETKPEGELSGDSVGFQLKQQQETDFLNGVAAAMNDAIKSGKPLTMADVKKMAGVYSELKGMSTTDLQELTELASVGLARDIARSAAPAKDRYDQIVQVYEHQPLLNARDSSRVEKQQYSTPIPFGFLMGEFVKANHGVRTVLEPSAGNGALTIAFDPRQVHVNDIDDRRVANLRKNKFGKITTQDGTLPFNEEVDAMLTNPPFGNTTPKEFTEFSKPLTISSLEGLMAINGLDSMKDNGRAAIIIGGNTEYRDNGVMKPKDMRLFKYLYSHYNVVDVINLDGAMYARNGTKCPVRMILIDGRKEFAETVPPTQSKGRAEQVHTFEELYNRVNDDILQLQQVGNKSASTDRGGTDSNRVGNTQNGEGHNRPDTGVRPKPIRTSPRGSENGGHTQQADKPTRPQRGGDGGATQQKPVAGVGNDNRGNAGGTDNVQKPATQGLPSVGDKSVADGRGGSAGIEHRDTADGNNGNRERLSVSLTDEKVAYPNRSQSGTLMSVVPANQAQVLAKSLESIGDVDGYLVDKLGYSGKDELYGYLAAEQIDSVSLAIDQMEKGNAFIIGDMTGVGKGRQGAALIRYAVKHGKTPIYFTQKPALFSDNYRDLSDIGSGELRPFIIASSRDGQITDAQGNVVHKIPSKAETERVFKYIEENGKLPDDYDYVLATYSQIQNGTSAYEAKGGEISETAKKYGNGKSVTAADRSGQIRRKALATLAKGNYVIMDESHTVGGSGGGAMYMQYLLQGAAGGTFLSATFAKRADNMPIYAMRTALNESGMRPEELIEAIKKGGVTLQEIMSKQLVESGQMIRRERSFQGVNIDWLPVEEQADKVQREQFNEVADIFSAIRGFQEEFIKPMVSAMSDELSDEGGYGSLTAGTEAMGVKNVPFASKMYNLVNQLLFALKADAVADRVIYNLMLGKKPVISFTNTMEGFLAEAPKDVPMDEMPNFSMTLQKALDGVMRYTTTDSNGDSEGNSFKVSDLSPEGQQRYHEISQRITDLSVNLSISPMDAIKMKIQEAGYSVGEITGRTTELTKDENGKYVVRNRTERDKKAAARDFNNGKLDVLMINKSGSTGISLHASPKFADSRQRVMVFAQFQSDINDEVQMRGRIDRTGQVYRGSYEYIMSSIPAEQRLQMMFKAKLKSLDANTTSSQKSKFNEMEVVDYLNKYGDEVTWQYMMEHPELEEKLGDPLGMLASKDEEDKKASSRRDNESKPQEGCAAKIARYLPFLPVEEQEHVFNDIAEAYKVKMQMLNDAGENDLEITTMPLRAETKSRKIWKQGTNPGSGNAFADNTYLEEVEVDVIKKPMKADEVRTLASKYSDGKDFDEWRRGKAEEVRALYDEKAKSAEARIMAETEERAKKRAAKYKANTEVLRAQGKNNLSDEEIRAMTQVAFEEVMANGRKRVAAQQANYDRRKEDVLKAIGMFKAMEPLVIPMNIHEDNLATTLIPSYGTFVGFKLNKDFSPSSSTAVFATLDGRRKVEIPLKETSKLNAIRRNSLSYNSTLRDYTMDKWDKNVPTQTRKTAYIVNGNLLQALVDTNKGLNTKGYLVSYTTMDGEVKQGILMPERFEPKNLKTSKPISSMKNDVMVMHGSVQSEDKEVSVTYNGYGWQGRYKISVPKSTSRGGKYFGDATLRKLVRDGEFETKGNSMVAFVENDENMDKVFARLDKMGVTVEAQAELTEQKEEENRFRLLDEDEDKELIDKLNSEDYVETYRAMAVDPADYEAWKRGDIKTEDLQLYPPMAFYTEKPKGRGKNRTEGVKQAGTKIGQWFEADENLDKAYQDKNGNWVFDLIKDNGAVVPAAYNPYIHSSDSPLNDQFSTAYKRPNIVVVKTRIPKSELTSGYKAEGAKDAVGMVDWKSGIVGGKLSEKNQRHVYLSRWAQPVEVMSEEASAKLIAQRLEGEGVFIPSNTVTPSLREALEKEGVPVVESLDENGKVIKYGDLAPQVDWSKYPRFAKQEGKGKGTKNPSEKITQPLRGTTASRESSSSQKDGTKVHNFSETAKIARLNLLDVAEGFKGKTRSDGFLTELAESIGARRDGGPSWYVEMVLPQHEKASIRISNHLLNAETYKKRGKTISNGYDNFAISIRSVRQHDTFVADDEVMADNFAYRKEDIQKDPTMLAKIAKSMADMMETGIYEDTTGKVLHFVSPKSRRDVIEMQDMRESAQQIADDLHVPVRIVNDISEVDPEAKGRKRRAKGITNILAGEGETAVTIVVGNHENVADIENTAFHEIVAHVGLRKLVGEDKMDGLLDEVYGHAEGKIKATIDERTDKMVESERERILEAKAKKGEEGVFAYAEAVNEAEGKRERYRREATEEYMADTAGKIGREGFEKMEAEELSFWQKVKQKVMNLLNRLLAGKAWAKNIKIKDKDIEYILFRSWKNLKSGGKMSAMDVAEDVVMREKTGYDKSDVERFRDGDMSLDEIITKMKAEAAVKNADDFKARTEAMKAIGGNLQKLRSAMARQKAYDVSTVKSMGDLAQIMMDNGLLDRMSAYETKRVLSVIKNSVGKEDLTGSVQQLMDIMVQNQLHNGENMLGNLFRLGRSHLNSRGVEVMGSLDADGQALVKAAKHYTAQSKEAIDGDIIPELLDRMGSSDKTIADNAAVEYDGVLIARRYVDEITESKAAERELRKSIRDMFDDHKAGKVDYDTYSQYKKEAEEAIRENRIERAEAYASIAEQLGGTLGESAERAKQWREAEKARVNEIHHNCNSDMEGRPYDEHNAKLVARQHKTLNFASKTILSPLANFDQILRMLGSKDSNGEGYLWNRYMRGWVDASNNEYIGYRDALEELDRRVEEIFGEGTKWRHLYELERKIPTVPVEFWDGGEKREHELTQGNLAYIYMVNKMSDGRMKLRAMGIKDEDVELITDMIDPRFIALADWIQDDFLVEKRNKYNEVHKRMFGVPMAAIDNYFPLKVLEDGLNRNEDVSQDENANIMMPGTTTGAVIKRTRNNKALDLLGSDAFSVVLNHVQEMEHWAAYAELIRDINTMLSYKHFRNQVKNMSSIYGAGSQLWSMLRKTAQLTVGAYRPQASSFDEAAVNIAKGVTAAKISFRMFTAFKQLMSYPAYLSDASPVALAKYTVKPWEAWKWAMNNLPNFEKRWRSRMAGDPRLLKTEMDWAAWRSKYVQMASRIGMSPNAFVDALVVSIGARAIYETKCKRYLKWGYDEETADKRAKQDATILFNSTQQSNEGPFLSPMQVDRTWLSTMFSVFRNSAMLYSRQDVQAARNLGHFLFKRGWKWKTHEYMEKMFERDGLTEEQAEKAASDKMHGDTLRNLVRLVTFSFITSTMWNLGSYLPYLLLGEDDEKKKEMAKDAVVHGMFGSIEGLAGGDLYSAAASMAAQGDWNTNGLEKNMPMVSDINSIIDSEDGVRTINDCIGMLAQTTLGVNPQSLTDAVVAVLDACGDDAQTSRECAMAICRVLNCPQSQIDQIYFDELGLDGETASRMSVKQLADRYARYKRRRNAPLTSWAYSDEGRKAAEKPFRSRAISEAKKRIEGGTDGASRKQLEAWREEYKATAEKVKAINSLRTEGDDAEADKQEKALESTSAFRRYEIMYDYNSDMNEVSKQLLWSQDPVERERLLESLTMLKKKMTAELSKVK